MQSQSLGYDGAAEFVPAGTTLSNAIGVHEGPAAELAMTLILASQRGWPAVGRNQDAERWERPVWPGLIGKRVLLIGVGGIGREFEKRIAGFDTELTRVARTGRDDIHGIDELPGCFLRQTSWWSPSPSRPRPRALSTADFSIYCRRMLYSSTSPGGA